MPSAPGASPGSRRRLRRRIRRRARRRCATPAAHGAQHPLRRAANRRRRGRRCRRMDMGSPTPGEVRRTAPVAVRTTGPDHHGSRRAHPQTSYRPVMTPTRSRSGKPGNTTAGEAPNWMPRPPTARFGSRWSPGRRSPAGLRAGSSRGSHPPRHRPRTSRCRSRGPGPGSRLGDPAAELALSATRVTLSASGPRSWKNAPTDDPNSSAFRSIRPASAVPSPTCMSQSPWSTASP